MDYRDMLDVFCKSQNRFIQDDVRWRDRNKPLKGEFGWKERNRPMASILNEDETITKIPSITFVELFYTYNSGRKKVLYRRDYITHNDPIFMGVDEDWILHELIIVLTSSVSPEDVNSVIFGNSPMREYEGISIKTEREHLNII